MAKGGTEPSKVSAIPPGVPCVLPRRGHYRDRKLKNHWSLVNFGPIPTTSARRTNRKLRPNPNPSLLPGTSNPRQKLKEVRRRVTFTARMFRETHTKRADCLCRGSFSKVDKVAAGRIHWGGETGRRIQYKLGQKTSLNK